MASPRLILNAQRWSMRWCNAEAPHWQTHRLNPAWLLQAMVGMSGWKHRMADG